MNKYDIKDMIKGSKRETFKKEGRKATKSDLIEIAKGILAREKFLRVNKTTWATRRKDE